MTKSTHPNFRAGRIDNFVEAGKKLRGEPAELHKWLSFLPTPGCIKPSKPSAIALMVDPQGRPGHLKAQQKMRATLDDWIPIILAAQEPDGYLQTRFTLAPPGTTGGRRHWDPRTRGKHEGYVAGYFIESAINHYT